MRLQYTVGYRYGLRRYYRRVLAELSTHLGITWGEEKQSIGCSSLDSVFTVECRDDQAEAIERRLLLRLPLYQLEQGGENYPVGHLDMVDVLQSQESRIILWHGGKPMSKLHYMC